MPDIQEAKWFEFTVQILPPPLKELLGGGTRKIAEISLPHRFISVYAYSWPNSWTKLADIFRGHPYGYPGGNTY